MAAVDPVRDWLAKLCGWADEIPSDEVLLDAAERVFCADKPPADPLAALDAAERALLAAGGWREVSGDRWDDDRGSRECRAVALTLERKRIAERGGDS